ncbi:MAG TPA: CbiX/SirB N-terminal domain-containing protein [Chloroflexota bacterium]|jgi:sirohydrochlorin ferrochelatase|nr:CbiX/SirB N-terminal domain-containing protein [Chloroflexota bacterium]
MTTAVVLLGHGSRAPEAQQYFLELAAAVREQAGSTLVEAAFLELCPPSLPETVAACVARGAARIVVVPLFLHPGRHLQHDIPRLVAAAQAAHPEVTVLLAPHLGAHPAITPLVTDLVRRALAAANPSVPSS